MNKWFLLYLVCTIAATKSDARIIQGDSLSDARHYTKDGKHDHTYDRESFLGKEVADQFKALTPEESKRRLGIIVNKIDKNKNGKVDKAELTDWIKHSLKKSAYDDAKMQMELQDLDNSGDLEFDEWVNTTYSYMAKEDRLDELYDQYRKITFRQQMENDKKAWEAADLNKDKRLSVDEFAGFLHPHDFPHMSEIVLQRTVEEMDANRDGFITKDEYLNDMYNPSRDGPDEPAWVQRERVNFDTHRDFNGDGKLDRDELRKWILPTHYDPFETEAGHLIHEADSDQDEVLSKQEILDNQDIFVASRVTEYGKQLTIHDEF